MSMFLEGLTDIVGADFIFTDEQTKSDYSKDHSFYSTCTFDVLVKPGSAREIAAILSLCNRFSKPVTPRGGGTGVTGGALTAKGGVMLSVERLDRIISIDVLNRYAIVEAGVITESLCNEIESKGMYFPVYPGSKAASFIGGNVAENAASPKSCKYGPIRNFVLNLEVVLPTGEIIWTGENVHKDVTGINLTQLFIGSEGVLGVITKVVLRILPRPTITRTILTGFRELSDACNACLELGGLSTAPSSVELITEGAIELTAPFLNTNYPLISSDLRAHLLIEWEEHPELDIEMVVEIAHGILEKYSPADVLVSTTRQEREFLWSLREKIDFAMTMNGFSYRDIDPCVPPASLFDFLCEVANIGKNYGEQIICFGHAMDGNMHTMLLLRDGLQPDFGNKIQLLLAEIYRAAIYLGGTISGEHGIGCLQQQFLHLQLSEKKLDLMRQIKSVFDPGHILNPGKMLLDDIA